MEAGLAIGQLPLRRREPLETRGAEHTQARPEVNAAARAC